MLNAPESRVEQLDCRGALDDGSDAERAYFAVYVPRDLCALRGHFRVWLIVPGVARLERARG